MRPSILVSLLLVSILLHEAQGIRLDKSLFSSSSAEDQTQIKGDIVLMKSSIAADAVGEKKIVCKDEKCSGMNRKLTSNTITSTTTTTTITTNLKNDKKDGNKANPATSSSSNPKSSARECLGGGEENFSVKPSPVPENREAAPEKYPDILDIAGMDYSPAKRKPPIHN